MYSSAATVRARFMARRGISGAANLDHLSPLAQEIVSDSLQVHYQPLVDLSSHKIFAYEALARSRSQRFRGPLPTFAAALQENCCGELGLILRSLALEHAPQAYPLFLNVHPNEFDEGWLVRTDEPMFWHTEAVFLEITEGVPLSHFALCRSVLREVRSKGVFLAVDDLGAGYSNLKYIADLAPEIVKIDREMIAGVVRSSRQHRLLAALVRLCTDMGARVVAEGIETAVELNAAIDAGVHYGQGYLLARPNYPAPTLQYQADW